MKELSRNLFILIIALSLAIITPFYFQEILIFSVVKIGLGWVISTVLIRLAVILFFIIALNAILLVIKKGNRTKLWIVLAAGIGPGFLLSFAIEPIYDIDYFMLGDNLELSEFNQLEEASSQSYQRENHSEVLAFLDVGCGHCQLACQKFGINKEAGQTTPIHLFFANDSTDVHHFLESNKGQDLTTHFLKDEASFITFAGFEFPSIFVIDSTGKTTYHWVGERMNYTALDYLLSLEQ